MAKIKQSKLSDSARKARNRLRKALSAHLKSTGESRTDQARRLGISASTVGRLRKNTRKKELSIDELITLLERAGLLAKVSVKKSTPKKKPGRKKAGAKKTTKKKSVSKKTARKKTTRKKVSRKKVTRKVTRKKTSAKKSAKKTATRKKATSARATPQASKKKVTRKKSARRKVSKKPAVRKSATRKKTKKKTASKTLFKAPAGKRDNLQRIKGIGPGMQRTLNRLGITTFRQIAGFKSKDVARVADAIGSFGGRVKSDGWVRQAGVLAAGGETAFSKRVDKGKVASSRRTR